ncbi:hypothetical protein ACFQ0B_33535 [Nonomuraea thailandensis]
MRRALVLLVLAASVLLVVIDRTLTPLAPVREAGASVYGAVESAVATAGRAFGGEERLRELERENAALRARLLSSGTRSVARLDVPAGHQGWRRTWSGSAGARASPSTPGPPRASRAT